MDNKRHAYKLYRKYWYARAAYYDAQATHPGGPKAFRAYRRFERAYAQYAEALQSAGLPEDWKID